MVSNHNTRA